MSMLGIHRIVDPPDGSQAPLRCLGCGWPASKLGPDVMFVGFPAEVDRGVIIATTGANAVHESLDELVLCAECILASALAFDGSPVSSAREKTAAEQRRLRDNISASTKGHADACKEVARSEKRIAELRATLEGLDALRVAASQWRASHLPAVTALRDAKARAWSLECAADAGEPAGSATEIAEARKEVARLRGELRTLTAAGTRLRDQCEEKRLLAEHALIRNQLQLGGADDG